MESFHQPVWKGVSNSQISPEARAKRRSSSQFVSINKPKAYQSIKALPSTGRKIYNMQNISFSLLWDSLYGIVRTETQSFIQLMIMKHLEFTGEEAEGYTSEVTCPVPPSVGGWSGGGGGPSESPKQNVPRLQPWLISVVSVFPL